MMGERKKWVVETAPDVFTDVVLPRLTVEPSGALSFRRGIAEPLELVLAPGTWLSVHRAEDESS
jgi:hypothetical protein